MKQRTVTAGPAWMGAIPWLGAGLIALLLDVPRAPSGSGYSVIAMSALALLFGAWLFYRHGGPFITPISAYGYAFAIFVGFAGLYLVGGSEDSVAEHLLAPLACAYFLQVTTWALFWSKRTLQAATTSSRLQDSDDTLKWGMRIGGLLLLTGCTVAQTNNNEGLAIIADAAAFVGVLLFGTSLLRRPGGGTWTWRVILIFAGLLAYYFFVFTGFGRLQLGALGVGLAAAACGRFNGRIVKVALLTTTAPIMMWLATSRADFTATLNPAQLSSVTGFESVVSPLTTYAFLFNADMASGFVHANGQTFWASLVSLVPGDVWEGKPDGLGAVLVPLVNPELIGRGHSEAALFFGEWVFNFGIPFGLLLMVPTVGASLGWVDDYLARRLGTPIAGRRDLLLVSASLVILGSMTDLVWNGTFVFSVRAGSRLFILLTLFLVTASLMGSRWRGRTERALRPVISKRYDGLRSTHAGHIGRRHAGHIGRREAW